MVALFRRLTLALLVLAFAAGLLSPLYEDEIAYRMMHSRLFLDHGAGFTLFPQCFPPDWDLSSNMLSVPYKALESVFYNAFPTPLAVRAAGVIKAFLLAWLALLVFSALDPSMTERKRDGMAHVLLPLVFGLGVAPLLFVMNRPEQEILLGIFFTTLMLLRSAKSSEVPRFRVDLTRAGVFLAALLLAITPHPNALFFLPLWLLAAAKIPRRGSLRMGSLAAVAVFTIDRAVAEAQADLCPRDPEMLGRIRTAALLPFDLFRDPPGFAAALWRSVEHAPDYFSNLRFQSMYAYGWAPNHSVTFLHEALNWCQGLLYAGLAGCAVAGLGAGAWAARDRRAKLPEAIGASVAASLLALMLFQLRKNWYGSALVVPPLALVAACFWPRLAGFIGTRAARAGEVSVAFVSLVSLSVFWWTFAWQSSPLLRSPGAHLEGSLTFSGFGYSVIAARLKSLAGRCGISLSPPPPRLAVDALTYWALRGSVRPIEVSYVSRRYEHSHAYPGAIGSLESFLKERGSTAILARCNEVIEPELRARAQSDGQLCCWNFMPGAP